jgi:hypothetical protein
MAAKNKFPRKLVDVNPNVSFEDMKNGTNTAIIDDDIENFSTQSTENFELLERKQISPEDFFGKDDEEMIPKSQIDGYIQKALEENEKKFDEKLQSILSAKQPEQIYQQQPKLEPAPKKVESADDLPEFENWEVKDRIYVLCTGFSSLSHGIKDRHKKSSPLMYKGRSLRYSTSQASFFMDKQVGDVLLSYLSIDEGKLIVPKENAHLQKFLAIHPDNGVVFKEFNPKEESKIAYDVQKLKVDAHILSRQLDTATLVAVAMLMCKDYTENADLFTVKRDLYNEIEINPKLFIKLASDQNLKLKSIGKIAVFRGLLKFANYRFLDENDVVICEANRNENEYDTLASYFSTTEGRNLFEYLVRKIEN